MKQSRLQIDYQHRQQLLLRVYRIALPAFICGFVITMLWFNLGAQISTVVGASASLLGERLTRNGRVREAAWLLLLIGAATMLVMPLFGEAGNDAALFTIAPLMVIAGLFLQNRAYWIYAFLLAAEVIFISAAEWFGWISAWYGPVQAIHIWPECFVILLAHFITCLLINVIVAGVGFFFITEQNSVSEQKAVWHRAGITDALTSLYNERGFAEHAQRVVKRARINRVYVSLFLIDIDYFNTIKEGFGQDSADHLLQWIAQHLLSDFRCGDVAGRIDEDKFCVVLTDLDKTASLARADKWRQHISGQPLHHDNSDIPFTISIGIHCSKQENDLAAIIKTANQALSQAKTSGRNNVVCFDDNVES